MQSGSTTTSARSSWSAARVIPDEVAKELLSQNELEMEEPVRLAVCLAVRVLQFGTPRAFLFKTPEYFFLIRGAF